MERGWQNATLTEGGNMQREARHAAIVNLVRQRGFVSIDVLAQHFNVTPQTMRRDINELSDQELLQRYHGGAGLTSSVEPTSHATRQVQFLSRSSASPGSVFSISPTIPLFINVGTTNEEVARALLSHTGLRVITNNLQVADILCDNRSCEVIVAGGAVPRWTAPSSARRPSTSSRSSGWTSASSASAVSTPTARSSTSTTGEVRVAQAMIENRAPDLPGGRP